MSPGMLPRAAQQKPERRWANYAAVVPGDSWRDARVRQAEDALHAAVRTADEIIADAMRAVEDRAAPTAPDRGEDEEQRSVLRDAW